MPEKNRSIHLGRLVLAFVCLVALALGVAGDAQAGEKAELKRVETKKVCMVNNQVFEKDQIPVAVGGKTYYGCCEMCKTALAEDEAKRTAIDPVSKRKVDKAVAVIGSDKQGRVYYFENETNLRAFTPSES